MDERMAKAIATWWASHLQTTQQNEEYFEEMSAESEQRASMLKRMLVEMAVYRLEDAEWLPKTHLFRDNLVRLLVEGPDTRTHLYGLLRYPHDFYLAVDYDPQGLLARALQLSGMDSDSCSGLPYKTSMRIYAGRAIIVQGHRVGTIVWPSADELPCVAEKGQEHAVPG
jgi:hypothetical protein